MKIAIPEHLRKQMEMRRLPRGLTSIQREILESCINRGDSDKVQELLKDWKMT